MTKEINNKSQTSDKKVKARKFRMAYSLNNWQPVQCTLVSDQPFFYMDEEYDLDDDAILDSEPDFAETFDLTDEDLLCEIASMKKKMEAYDRLPEVNAKSKNQSIEQMILDSENLSIKAKVPSSQDIKEITSILSESRMGEELIAYGQDTGISFKFSNQTETATFDKQASTIFVRQDLEIVDQVLLVAQELRRAWQEGKGANINPLSLHPDEAILINRSQKADLAVAVVRCAWELKLQGRSDIWTRIEQSSMSDLGRALAREALSDFRTLNNGKASSAVFETWFLSERCQFEDKTLINAMLADYRGYMFDSREMSMSKVINLICKLGEQPFGKNYLASYAQMITNDTLFTEVRDRSNANFLWFIKFERSFKETEQELQSSNAINMVNFNDQENKHNNCEDTQDDVGFNPSATDGSNIIRVQFGADTAQANLL